MEDEQFWGSIVSGLRPSSQYDTGAMSVTSGICVAGRSSILDIQKFDITPIQHNTKHSWNDAGSSFMPLSIKCLWYRPLVCWQNSFVHCITLFGAVILSPHVTYSEKSLLPCARMHSRAMHLVMSVCVYMYIYIYMYMYRLFSALPLENLLVSVICCLIFKFKRLQYGLLCPASCTDRVILACFSK